MKTIELSLGSDILKTIQNLIGKTIKKVDIDQIDMFTQILKIKTFDESEYIIQIDIDIHNGIVVFRLL